jgi:preprotein translocase SecE subunit
MEAQKAGQGSLTRLVTWMVLILASAMGCVELYTWIQSPAQGTGEAPWADRSLLPGKWFEQLPLFGVPFSVKFVVCLALLVALLLFVRWWMRRPSMADTLVETEQEMKKVSWPTKQESFNAMWVVLLVTIVLTFTLWAFDGALHVILRLVF